MSGIISHVVDSAANAVAGAQEMKLLTKKERPLEVHMMKCMPHKASTSAMTALGTSNHVENLNPEAGEILKHVIIYQRESIENVPGARQWWRYTRQISTHEVSFHSARSSDTLELLSEKASIFNCKRHDLHKSLHNMLDDGSCDNDSMKGEKVNPEEVRTEHTLQPDQWIFLQQYEGGMDPIYQLIVFMQNKMAIHCSRRVVGANGLSSKIGK